MHRIIKFLKSTFTISFGFATFFFTFAPDCLFTHGFISVDFSTETIVACNKLLSLVVLAIIIGIFRYVYNRWIKKDYTINGNGYKIVVEYGDIFKKDSCKKVINFDECFSTCVGSAPADIKPNSICGQFLSKFPDVDFDSVVENSDLKPSCKHSAFNNSKCYDSGSIIPFNDYLLLAFAKLDKDGLGRMTRDEYLQCLELMWKEISKHYNGTSVALPILGSGITRFKDETLTHQQLLDMIIASYKLSADKIKFPAELHVVCRKEDSFSFSKIGEYI